jgi:hypothetical protein
MAAVVVPMTLESDAMSYIVFSSGAGEGAQSRWPTPMLARIVSLVPMMAYAPGNALSA